MLLLTPMRSDVLAWPIPVHLLLPMLLVAMLLLLG